MASISVSKARLEMKDLVNRVAYGKERIYLTSHDNKMAVLVPVEDIEALEAMEDLHDVRIAEERISLSEKEGILTSKELRKRLGIDV
jgi:prevent-host-death family protein